jgi:ArsR family transcriptional regulator
MILLKLKALADENRLEIIKTLFSGKKTVSEITKSIGRSQPNTSIALKQLLIAGLIQHERKGKCSYYSIKNKEDIKAVLELMRK